MGLAAPWLKLWLALAGLTAGLAGAEFVPLYQIEAQVEGAIGSDAPRIKLKLKSPESAIRRSDSVQIEDGWLVIDLARDSPATDPPKDEHLRSTFLVDFDEAPVQELLSRLDPSQAADQTASQILEALVVLTDEVIPLKTAKRGWDAASIVAKRGEGDCTEHAVLLAALARARGLPARVVIGSLVEVVGEETGAYGHAWTEVYDGEVWRRADAAQYLNPELAEMAEEMGQRLYYVPLAVVESEGPSFLMDLFAAVDSTHPQLITLTWGGGGSE